MDNYQDFYEILQVHPKASADVIKKAYYTLMQQNHPDKGGSDEIAKKITEAYQVLKDENLRKKYDLQRKQILTNKLNKTIATNKDISKENKENIIYNNFLSSFGTLVFDERGNKIAIIDLNGQINWEYGKYTLKSPKFAVFSDKKNILITDTGNNRILEINHKKEVLWSFGSNENNILNSPQSCIKTNDSTYLITDKDNKRVIEVNKEGNIVWQYGDLKDYKMFGKSIFSLVNKSSYILFNPVYADRLENGNTLICDTGNKRIIEVSKDKKIVWQYPKKNEEFIANFAYKQANGNVLCAFDKVYEITSEGNIVWNYSRNISDIDINWVLKNDKNQVLINFTRIVRRGVNQEIMLVDLTGKVIWRYYYSQYKYL
ncbi:MAG: hypothetical protein KatS3mg068_1088 [Candidatus Sericytochromatia bacterium]|nr:MAG: hypothetical protein KatS3mg068_1088 [Candidatus Sericytochromatia bacterium]